MSSARITSTDPTCSLTAVRQTTPPANAPAPAPAGALPQTILFQNNGATATQITLECEGKAGGTTTVDAVLNNGVLPAPVASVGAAGSI